MFPKLALDRLDANEGEEKEPPSEEALDPAPVGAAKMGTPAKDAPTAAKITLIPIEIADDFAPKVVL